MMASETDASGRQISDAAGIAQAPYGRPPPLLAQAERRLWIAAAVLFVGMCAAALITGSLFLWSISPVAIAATILTGLPLVLARVVTRRHRRVVAVELLGFLGFLGLAAGMIFGVDSELAYLGFVSAFLATFTWAGLSWSPAGAFVGQGTPSAARRPPRRW